MARTTKTISVSLPPEMAEQVDKTSKKQGRSRSDFVRAALLRYFGECEWRELLTYGEHRARVSGLDPEDVAPMVEEYRTEAASAQQ